MTLRRKEVLPVTDSKNMMVFITAPGIHEYGKDPIQLSHDREVKLLKVISFGCRIN